MTKISTTKLGITLALLTTVLAACSPAGQTAADDSDGFGWRHLLRTFSLRNKQMAGQVRWLLQQRPVPFIWPQIGQLMIGEPCTNTNPRIMAGNFVAADQPEQATEPKRPKPTTWFYCDK